MNIFRLFLLLPIAIFSHKLYPSETTPLLRKIHQSMTFKELDPNNHEEIAGICTIFRDPKVQDKTGIEDYTKMENYIERELNYARRFILCKTPNNTVSGVLKLKEDFKESVAAYETIAVHKDYRKQGVASALLQTTENHFLAPSICLVHLQVQYNNTKAVCCYKKHGFKSNPGAQLSSSLLSKICPCFSPVTFGMFKMVEPKEL
ncbi:GNAT family N-acetyltransferase [Candidatus Babeliales bacterium]|nr:GNAT family N-acetyltransferase [Candidatus Babeliales bacterium]MBP9843640.1 GNAT family N-acetyltransferase [Candidatus Babeliales bacterium]